MAYPGIEPLLDQGVAGRGLITVYCNSYHVFPNLVCGLQGYFALQVHGRFRVLFRQLRNMEPFERNTWLAGHTHVGLHSDKANPD